MSCFSCAATAATHPGSAGPDHGRGGIALLVSYLQRHGACLLFGLGLCLIPTATRAQSLSGSNSTNFNIPDNSSNWATSSITLSGAPSNATITSVSVAYDVKHPYRGDLKIWATAFYGGSWHDVVLRNRDGGSSDNWTETRSGLTNWNGASPNQIWYLSVQDLAAGDTGFIDSFSITVNYTVPASPADLLPQNVSVSPATVTAGNSVTVSYAVRNSGGTSAPASRTKVQIKLAGGAELVSQTFATSSVGANSSVNESRTLSIPSNAAGGTYQAFVIVDNSNDVNQSNRGNDASSGTSFAITAVAAQADLALSGLAVSPTTLTTRAFTSCSFTVANNGPTALTNEGVMVEYFLSTDTTFGDADDIKIGDTGLSVSVGSGTSTTVALSGSGLANMVRLWPSGATGDYYVYARIAVSDGSPNDPNIGNNHGRTTGRISYTPVTLADLVPLSVSLSANSVMTGGNLTVNYAVRNSGGTNAPTSRTRVQIKSATGSELVAQTFSTTAVSANSSVNESRTLTIPSSAAAGSYHVFVIVDNNSEVAQSNFANDASAGIALTITATVPQADLVLSGLSVSPTTLATRAFTACTFTLTNNGPSALTNEGILLEYYLSTDTTFGDSDDVKIGDTTLTVSIPSGGNSGFNLSTTGLANAVRSWPSSATGNYYVFARVTISDGSPTDPTVANNFGRTSARITYAPATLADLTPQSVTVSPSTVTAGGTISVNYTVRNRGGTGAPASHTKVQVKRANGSELMAPVFSTAAVGAGASVNESRTLTIPAETPAGTYAAFVIVDNNSEVSQSSETNDSSAGVSFTVEVPRVQADLALSGMVVAPASLNTRAFAETRFTLTNRGPTALTNEGLVVEYYLSTDTTFGDADDVKIGDTGHTLSLASGANTAISLTTAGLANMARQWPTNLPAGDYYVFARATISDGSPSDPDSSNNRGRTTGRVTYAPATLADLLPQNVSLSTPSAAPGSNVLVRFTVRNAGGTGAPASRTKLQVKNGAGTELLAQIFSTAPIDANSSVSETRVVPVPASTAAGNFSVFLTVDSENQVPESNETNNVSPGIGLSVEGPLVVTVTAPNGGENWSAGATQKIEWRIAGATSRIAYFKIRLSTDGGDHYSTDLTPNGLSAHSLRDWSWPIPSSLSSTRARIRVLALDENGQVLAQDNSDGNFAVARSAEAPAVVVTSPNGGELWAIGRTYNITANVTGAIRGWSVHYSIDGGGVWDLISESSTTNPTISVPWRVPNAPTRGARVRVTAMYGTSQVSDVGNGTFTILGPPGIPSNPAPATGSRLNSQPAKFRWAAANNATSYDVFLRSGGGVATRVAGDLPTNEWTPTQSYEGAAFSWYVVAKNAAGEARGADWTYQLSTGPSLRLVSPNGGEDWIAGRTYPINWDPSAHIGPVAAYGLALSTDGGRTFTNLLFGRLNDPAKRSWDWSILFTLASERARIRVQAFDSDNQVLAEDVSDADFAVRSALDVAGTLRGNVFDDRGRPLSNASVSGGGKVAISGGDGAYEIAGIAPGQISVHAQKEGYVPAVKTTTVSARSTIILNFTLGPVTTSSVPRIADVSSRWNDDRRPPVYFLRGVQLNVEFTANVDWQGLPPGEIRWIRQPGGLVQTGGITRTYDIGRDFSVGGGLQVQAVSANGRESAVYPVKFGVIDSPISATLLNELYATPTGNTLRYHAKLGVTSLFNIGAVVPKDFIFSGGKELRLGFDPELELEILGSGEASAVLSTDVTAKRRNGHIARFFGHELPFDSVGLQAEWSYGSSGWRWDAGYVSFGIKGAGFSTPPQYWLYPGPPVPLPMYLRADGRADLDVRLGIRGWADRQAHLEGLVEFSPEASIVLGVGVSGIFSVEGYLSGGPVIEVALRPLTPAELRQFKIALHGGIRVTAFLFKYENDLLNYEVDLKPFLAPSSDLRTTSRYLASLEPHQFELMSRDYLQPQPIAQAAAAFGPSRAAAIATDPVNTVRPNVFPFSESRLLPVADELVLAWIRDNPQRSAVNRTELVTLRGRGSRWAAEKAVWSDGAPDFQPTLARSAGGALIAWTKGRSALSDNTNLDQMSATLEIATASYDAATDSWSGAMRLTNNDHLDRNPMVGTGPDGSAMLVWIANEANDLLGSTAKPNKLMFARRTGTGWSESAAAATGLGAIVKADLAYNGTEALVVYSTDVDGDLATEFDRELRALRWNGNNWSAPIVVTDDTVPDNQPKLAYTEAGDLLLIWARGDGISMVRNQNFGTPLIAVQRERSSGLSDFTLATSAGGRIAVTWQDGSADGVDLWTALYDPQLNVWGKPQQITASRDMERSIATTFDTGGRLQVAFDRVTIDQVTRQVQSGGQTITVSVPQMGRVDLCVLERAITADLSVSSLDLTLSDPNPSPGAPVTITGIVRNLGGVALRDVTVAFYDGDPAAGGSLIAQQTLAEPMASGEARVVSVDWTVPSAPAPRSLFVAVDPDVTQNDGRRDNNVASKTVFAPDLAVTEVLVERFTANALFVTARVENRGSLPTTPTDVAFRIGSAAGRLLGRRPVEAIEAQAFREVAFEWRTETETLPEEGAKIFAAIDETARVADFQKSNNTMGTFVPADTLSTVRLASVEATSFRTVKVTLEASDIAAAGLRVEGASSLGEPVSWSRIETVTVMPVSSGRYELTVAVPENLKFIRVAGSSSTGPVVSVSKDIAALMEASAISRLSNVSIRSTAGGGDRTLIVGFVVGGGGEKPLLIRGVGPTLTQFGVSGVLADPQATIFRGSVSLASNNDWGTSTNAAQIASVAASVGAFTLLVDSRDAALLSTIEPGPYTVQIAGPGLAQGVALAEVYDADLNRAARLVNVSARTEVGSAGNILIAGFTINGATPKAVLIRGIGPTLTSFGVQGAIADPQLGIYSGSTRIAENNDWGAAPDVARLASTSTAVGAFALPNGSRDAALLLTLSPGSYTAQVSGVNNVVGVALVEIYEVP